MDGDPRGRETDLGDRSGSPVEAAMRTKIIRACQALVLIGVALTVPPQCLGKDRPNRADWSDAQNIDPGRRVRITLHDKQIPRGSRRLKGVFASADESSVSAVLPDGLTKTLERAAVRRVSVRRPFFKRPGAWIATAITAGVVQATLGRHVAGDWGRGGTIVTLGAFIYLPVWGVTSLMMSHKVVYDTPSP